MVAAGAAVALLVVVAHIGFDVPWPGNPAGFVVAVSLGMAALFALNLMVAAVAPTASAASSFGGLLYFAAMFLGGVYLPRVFLPAGLQRVGELMPPGVQGIQDAWLGSTPDLVALLIMAAITVGAGLWATRLFRWS
jgi:ABC-2 type transport system permease protein